LKDNNLRSISSWTLYLKPLQFSMVCPGDPAWYSHLAFTSKYDGYGGTYGGRGFGSTNPFWIR
jgi:hypothetical protein